MHPTKRYAFSYRPSNNAKRVRRIATGFNIYEVLEREKSKVLAGDPHASGWLIVDIDQGR